MNINYLSLFYRCIRDTCKDKGKRAFLLLILVIIVLGLYLPEWFTDWLTWLTVALALAIFINDIYTNWKENLPKKMTVFFTIVCNKTNREKITSGYLNADLPHAADIRQLSQQLGKSLYGGKYLELDAGSTVIFQHPSPIYESDGFQMEYAVIVRMTDYPDGFSTELSEDGFPFLEQSFPKMFRVKNKKVEFLNRNDKLKLQGHVIEFYQKNLPYYARKN